MLSFSINRPSMQLLEREGLKNSILSASSQESLYDLGPVSSVVISKRTYPQNSDFEKSGIQRFILT